MPPPKRTAVGLINRANDCFANANIQALAGCPNLYLYLHQLQFICPERKNELILLSKTLSGLIAQLNESIYTPKSITIQPVISAIEYIHKSYLSRSQHDAHEMLHLLLETLQSEVQSLSKLVSGVPPFIFEGMTMDTIKCRNCGYTKHTQQASFLVLTLAVPQKRGTDVQTLLEEYQAHDLISEYNCPQCQVIAHLRSNPTSEYRQYLDTQDYPELPLPPASSPIEKSTTIKKLPENLAIHLNRSIYSGGAQRNSCKVAIPEYLELSDDETTRKYRLCALIRHAGSHSLGHYECARRKNFEFWKKHSHQFDEGDFVVVPQSPHYSAASIKSVRSLASLASSVQSDESDLPFPAPASAQASVETTPIHAAHSAPTSPRIKPLRYQGPKFWNISDTLVKENTLSQAVGKQSSNYLIFYEKVRDVERL